MIKEKPQKQDFKGKKKRGPKGPTSTSFKPGQSGNPGGAPPKAQTLAGQIRDFLEEKDPILKKERAHVLRETAYDIALTGEKDSDRLNAIELLYKRGWGSAPMSLDISGTLTILDSLRSLPDDEIQKQIDDIKD